jgi:exodeoxyribonuclease-5
MDLIPPQGNSPTGALAHLAKAQIILTPEQQEGSQRIQEWYKTRHTPIYRLGGFAGTGKTTLIKHVIKEGKYGNVACCAFTGKAASVLTRKGVSASTIHSLIYGLDEDAKTREPIFYLKSKGELDLDLIIVDEASMISTELYEDLTSFDIPILFVGDPGQLEPVGDNPNLMKEPDFTLQTIHRQALDSPIISLANTIRTIPGYRPALFGSKPPALYFKDKKFSAEDLLLPDQLICAKNKTREMVNNKVRSIKGYNLNDGIHVGEKLICVRNNRTLGFYNGQTFTILEIVNERVDHFECKVENENGGKSTVLIWAEPFFREIDKTVDRCPKEFLQCEFGYCITCHKSQGSEWPNVTVVYEFMPAHIWDMARWGYTAVTRASSKLTMCL